MICDLELVKKFKDLYKKRVVVYGTGKCGREIAKILININAKLCYFCDGNCKKWGIFLNEKKILSPYELKKMSEYGDILIIIASQYFNDIVSLMNHLQISLDFVYTYFGFKYALYFNIESSYIPEQYRQEYKMLYNIWKESNLYAVNKAWSKCLYLDLYYEDPIFILCPGKTGSQTIKASLDAISITNIRLHDFIYHKYLMNNVKDDIRMCFDKMKNRNKVKIISSVREPISKDIAHFFQKLSGEYENHAKGVLKDNLYKSFNNLMKEYTYENKLIKERNIVWWLDYVAMLSQDGPLFDWFQLELQDFCGINVYDYEFDKEKGYTIIKEKYRNFYFSGGKIEFIRRRNWKIYRK